MALNDVWRNLGNEIGVYYRGRWDRVPSNPGVYAWFYPLRLTSTDLQAFVQEVQLALSFEASCEGMEYMTYRHKFSWYYENLSVERGRLPLELTPEMHARWQTIAAEPPAFEAFRHALLKASLLMPPLYVGKTSDLRTRCGQHLAGGGGNDFHKRFQTFAADRSLPAREVTDLILVTISTVAESSEPLIAMEDVLEAALKAIAAPPYSAI